MTESPNDIVANLMAPILRCIKRIRCRWRYAHRESRTIGWFRYDVGGCCSDCGRVGDGFNSQDDCKPSPVWGVYKMKRIDAWRAVRGLDHD